MNKYDKESVEFVQKAFKEGNLDLEITSDQYDRKDLTFEFKDTQYSVEVKKRRFKMNKYPTTIIERDKYDYLISHNGILVVLFDDCWIIIKDLKSAFVKETKKWASKTTDFNDKRMVQHTFVELSLKEIKKYFFDKKVSTS